MKIDYHTHHARCGHAIGNLEEYVQQGIRLGLDQLGLSDHMPLLHVNPVRLLSGDGDAYGRAATLCGRMS